MFRPAPRAARTAIGFTTLLVALIATPAIQAQNGQVAAPNGAGATSLTPNYDLAAAWMPQKVSRLVFDTSVAPRWLETSDRFWYSYNTREGRKFLLVDPVKKTKAPLFDHAKMAAQLTMITRIPYDAQHLPFTQVRFNKDDTAFEFDVQVPRDAAIPSTKSKTTGTEAAAGGGRDGG